MNKINLAQKLSLFSDHWSPKIIADLNGQQLKLAKLQGEFVWHRHEKEDEMFLVLQGDLVIQLRDREIALRPGELFVVPRGVEHRPVARDEAHVLLLEPAGTLNTGGTGGDRTVIHPERI